MRGEELRDEHIAFWRVHAPDTALINEYGPSETVVGCCTHTVAGGASPFGRVPIGRPIDNTELFVLDNHLQPVPIGVPGELYIGGDGLARGYLGLRDLTDSTVMRNLGVACGHALLAWRSARAGLERIEPDAARIALDLDAHWEVLAEAIQTVLRAHGVADAYERLKDFTRGRDVGAPRLRAFVATLGLPDDARRRLESLTPATYTGLAEALARDL